ncbi:chemotaxis protein CheD [Thalassobacillus hwangdonensis]|uniref:Probable chemoreceptor glutamine deamidase CheD n=1 Tax=Thalassobacillus hwangdonensis TaxID=546108 RepID=A0ABW3KXD0_9BACI
MNKAVAVIKVGIADMNIVREGSVIRTSGLGSCVGVIIYDHLKKVAGMAHIMLPDSTLSKGNIKNLAKYANTAIDELMKRLLMENVSRFALKAKIAGGAQMFQFSNTSDMMRIGPRNVDAVKKCLKEHGIPLIAEDVGGNNGRTIEFDPITGMLRIRTVNKGVSEI